MDRLKYFIINKPYGVISQFSKEGEHKTLADLGYNFPKDVYPVGRLDTDSEGLLVLTNDKALNNELLNPKHGHMRTYLVQLDGDITQEALDQLKDGIEIRVKKNTHFCKAIEAKKTEQASYISERHPPIRYRANIPTSWIEIKLNEGKNRQVRKMMAKVGFPALRLIRTSIEDIKLIDYKEVVNEIDKESCYKQLKI